MKKIPYSFLFLLLSFNAAAQLQWQNVDSSYQPLPASLHVYKTTSLLDGKPNIAYYVEADLKDRHLEFTVDTTVNRRKTPTQFYLRDHERFDPHILPEHIRHPLVVVNTTFFSFATNQSLNVVIKNGKLLAYNIHTIPGRGKDTLTYRHPVGSAIGISKKRKADIAWLATDSSWDYAYASQEPVSPLKDSLSHINTHQLKKDGSLTGTRSRKLSKWKMETAVGGGPVLVQDGNIKITNEQELKFYGKAINDKHPRTAMGYTKSGKLIILVVEGRHEKIAEGATLTQLARIFKDLDCVEALNLDGGGSSCMLVNGKETIKVSDAGGQRPVPAVFEIFTQ